MSQLADFKCPICMDIYIEPVVLPCEHCLCKPCFGEHVEKTSLQCPLCRKRLGSWARLNGRNGTLVNQEKWKLIQKRFPDEVKIRLQGGTPKKKSKVAEPVMVQLAQDGEIHAEYQQELDKLRREKDEENRASEILVKKLLEEDQKEIEKARKQISKDARHAFKLANKENEPKKRERKLPPTLMGPRSDSVDSIGPELRHFKPIARFPRTPPHRSAGAKSHPEAIKVEPCPKTVKKICFTSPSPNILPESCAASVSNGSDSPPLLPMMPSTSDLTLPVHSEISRDSIESDLSSGRYVPGYDSDTASYHSEDSVVMPVPKLYKRSQSNGDEKRKTCKKLSNGHTSLPSTSADVNGNVSTSTKSCAPPITQSTTTRDARLRKRPISPTFPATSAKNINGIKTRSASTPSVRIVKSASRKRTTSVNVTKDAQLHYASSGEFKNDEDAARHFQKLFDLEVKYDIDSSRLAGGDNAYSFRKRRKV